MRTFKTCLAKEAGDFMGVWRLGVNRWPVVGACRPSLPSTSGSSPLQEGAAAETEVPFLQDEETSWACH